MAKIIKILQDDSGYDYRDDNDNLGVMTCFGNAIGRNENNHTLQRAKEIEADPDFICVPIYGYSHGGVTISTTPFTCPFDSGKAGFIYVSKDMARELLQYKVLTKKRIELIKSYLVKEVETYDLYLQEGIFYFEIYEEGKVEDSCGGFIGDDPYKNGIVDSIGKDVYEASHKAFIS